MKKREIDQYSYLTIGIALGVGVGTAIGTAMGNIAIGTAIGAGIGFAIGLAFSSKNKDARRRKVKNTFHFSWLSDFANFNFIGFSRIFYE